MTARICLITPWHLANNPRLVKEAHALRQAGYTVEVVAGRYFPPMDGHDAPILATARWRTTFVDYRTRPCTLGLRLAHAAARKWAGLGLGLSTGIAARAHHRASRLLAARAGAIRADLYIGHTLPGLYAAASAAARNGARFAFDAEDFHAAETDRAENDTAERRSIERLERMLLPKAAYVSAAAPLIADAYVARYGLRRPHVILNTFPLSEGPAPVVSTDDTPDRRRRLYWFSQTIGPGRGLEPMIDILGLMRTPTELHLRGLLDPAYGETLRLKARAVGVPVTFHPVADASEMARLAAAHDVGLSLELPTPRNRDLCLTNKLFTYLLAGLPVVLTRTQAQARIAPELGGAGLLLSAEGPAASARALDAVIGSAHTLRAAKQAAATLAHERYNWDLEQKVLLDAVAVALHSTQS